MHEIFIVGSRCAAAPSCSWTHVSCPRPACQEAWRLVKQTKDLNLVRGSSRWREPLSPDEFQQ
eukprot:9333958-Karenia_brevis.AAC.1